MATEVDPNPSNQLSTKDTETPKQSKEELEPQDTDTNILQNNPTEDTQESPTQASTAEDSTLSENVQTNEVSENQSDAIEVDDTSSGKIEPTQEIIAPSGDTVPQPEEQLHEYMEKVDYWTFKINKTLFVVALTLVLVIAAGIITRYYL